MEKRVNKFIKVFPWYQGLEGDLLFYISVDTLFLTVVKNFSAVEIVSLTAVSQFICIILQFPLLFFIKKIGNTASVRTGAACLLSSAILITFGKSYYLVLLGKVFHDIAAVLRSASIVMLENNLELVEKRKEFVVIRTKANTVYASITMVISFVISIMFNLNHYLPMFGCITTCTIGFILSLYMKDYSAYNKIRTEKKKSEKIKINYNKLIIIAMVVFSIFYPIVNEGQSQGKLFIQQHILADYSVDDTSIILGVMICISRIVRVFSNILFVKAYKKYQEKMGMVLPILLCIAIGCLLFGSFFSMFWVKISIMSIGYIIILFARDPFRLYMQDVLFAHAPKEQHQTMLTMLEFGVKIGTVAMGLSFSAILIKYPMVVIIAITFIIALIEVLLSVKMYRMISCKSQTTK